MLILAGLGRWVPPADATTHPFGSHTQAYASGSIRPNQYTQSQLDADTRSFYDAWKAKYLISGCGTGRYYIDVSGGSGGGRSAQSITVSEGHGYGMVIAALMAGYDPQAQAIFDGLYWFFKDHPSINDPYLMAWNQVQGCGDANGPDSATDGDLDIAYSLLLADQQWGSSGSINYLQEGRNVISAIKAKELHPSARTVLLGDWASQDTGIYLNGTRPSDFMLDHFRAFQAATGDPVWTQVIAACQRVVSSIQTNYSPATGLVPDFVENAPTTPMPAVPNYLEASTDGDVAYNSCRVPWRLGTDFLVSGDASTRAEVQKINTWVIGNTHGDPTLIRSGYHLDGTAYVTYYDMPFVVPFAVGAMVDASNQAWLNSLWGVVRAQPLASEDYFGNTLKMLGMIVLSGNWWTPSDVAAPPPPIPPIPPLPPVPPSPPSSNPTADFSNVRVFPNPWRSDRNASRPMTFDGLTPGATVNIFTVSGHHVKTVTAGTGSAVWDLTNESGSRVASGYYLYLATDAAGHLGRGKFAIIR